MNPPKAYYCDGDGFAAGASGIVAGRIGAGGANAPYVNPFGDGTLCKNTWGVGAHYSTGASEPDGYTQLSYQRSWTNVVTVWRAGSYTAILDPVYKYRFYALSTRANPMAITLSQTTAAPAAGTSWQQQPLSYNPRQLSALRLGEREQLENRGQERQQQVPRRGSREQWHGGDVANVQRQRAAAVGVPHQRRLRSGLCPERRQLAAASMRPARPRAW